MNNQEPLSWRQCSCFLLNEIPDIKTPILPDHHDNDAVYILLTHSCSLATSDYNKEPKAEYIVARKIVSLNPAFVGRRNPRILHLELLNGSQIVYCELNICERGFFDRRLLEKGKPSTEWSLPVKSSDILIRWLVARYNAPAFPDAFNNRLNTVSDKIEKQLKKSEAQYITGLWVDMEPDEEELAQGEPYKAEFVLTMQDGLDTKTIESCETMRKSIQTAIESLGQDSISLEGGNVQLISEDEMTISDLRGLKLIQLDYLSERDKPGGKHPVVI